MMFKNAAAIESVCWQMRLADWDRAINRAKINDLGNGWPPYTTAEVVQNNINFNYNSLEATKIFHDARRQFYSGMLAPDPLFTVDLDYGPLYRRKEWAATITKCINKIITKSLKWTECQRSVFAMDVLHGIGPAYWETRYDWCPKAIGIEDVMIPSGTELVMDNLPFFSVYRQYTGMELEKLISSPRNAGWNVGLAKRAINWVDQESQQLLGSTWPDVWSPEKQSERIKEDCGLTASDQVPTIDCWDFYFWDDSKKKSGWNRRIVLDAWGTPGVGGAAMFNVKKPDAPSWKRDRDGYIGKGEYLFNSEDRKYAPKLSQMIHWQFADGSCVAPFRYHSVRSLGFLIWAVCNVQNRLRCKFTEAAFESMMQYLRSESPDDAERALAINLVDKRVLPAGVKFENERWVYDKALVETVLQMNRQSMSDNSSSFTQDFDFAAESKRDETATRTMAKVNSTAALVGAMLEQAYTYEEAKIQEICRRFCIPNSKDPDVRKFRKLVLNEGVPEEALNVDRWNIQMSKVIGSGNKTLQTAMANQLMAVYDKLNPESQQDALRLYIAANLDYDWANRLVPQQRHISDSVSWAQSMVGTIMEGGDASPKPGINTVEVIETWLHQMAKVVARCKANGNMASADEIVGLQNFSQHIQVRIQMLAQDPNMRQRVKVYKDDLGKLDNEVKGFVQRLQEQQQKQNANGQMDPKDAAKIQAIQMQAQVKAQNAAQSHAQRTAQRQIQFEHQLKQDAIRTRADVAKQDLEAAGSIRRNRLKGFDG